MLRSFRRSARWTTFVLTLMFSTLMVACQTQAAQPIALTRTPTTSPIAITPTLQSTTTLATTAATAAQEPVVISLVIWWPDRLAPLENAVVQEYLSEQIAAFETSVGNVEVELRLKRAQETGGIMASLRSASQVAPGVLPDITLIRRDDLTEAAQNRLIQPLEGRVASGVLADLYNPALQLGWVNGELYGLAYVLDMQVLAYNTSALPTDELPQQWSFQTILDNNLKLAFPAVRSGTISDIFFLQYLSAGGTLASSDTPLTLNEDALLSVLTFYEQALADGLIDQRALEYAASSDYQPALLTSDMDAGIVNSSSLRNLTSTNTDLSAGNIPTADGTPRTILNGWHWVMVTQNAERQAVVSQFINWMMDSQRQGEYTQLIGWVPSQRSALRLRPFDSLDTATVEALIDGSIPPMSSDSNSAAVRAMHGALLAVLTGGSTAEQAVAEAVNQLAD